MSDLVHNGSKVTIYCIRYRTPYITCLMIFEIYYTRKVPHTQPLANTIIQFSTNNIMIYNCISIAFWRMSDLVHNGSKVTIYCIRYRTPYITCLMIFEIYYTRKVPHTQPLANTIIQFSTNNIFTCQSTVLQATFKLLRSNKF